MPFSRRLQAASRRVVAAAKREGGSAEALPFQNDAILATLCHKTKAAKEGGAVKNPTETLIFGHQGGLCGGRLVR
jgi:hypothetical protein